MELVTLGMLSIQTKEQHFLLDIGHLLFSKLPKNCKRLLLVLSIKALKVFHICIFLIPIT